MVTKRRSNTPSWLLRNWTALWRLAAAALLGSAFLGGAAGAAEIWRTDNLQRVGGEPVKVVGAPVVAGDGGTTVLVFDGVDDGIFLDRIPIAGASAFTVEMLFLPAADGKPEQRFFHMQDEQGRRGLLELRSDERGWWLDAYLRHSLDAADRGLVLIDPKQPHPLGRWYWVAMRYDGKRLTSFVDGVKQLEGAYVFGPIGQGKVSLGVRQTLVSWFKGSIREVRFHREAIPDSALQRAR
ncbi:LamG-like jellyroll fold domain-containing protein [Opitutus sp. ER46]|uniref:LamG-like jellyroll fold domain-containing protein n=1 Tax=Opitutus sp. ER46 TaxID=2161864 RepID=UPI000D3210D3|nr:LamG-like jellyroll fold domain-containing protein [Opitutus sp. ER46]PTX92509.1 laminin G [Opitutus sp. ER46]